MEYTSDNHLSNLRLNESNDKSDSESTHSTPEDERIKRLFFTCDTNGDGFITYDDIRQVCIQLNMEYCVDEIMQQLGTDANGRISYSDFVKRRSELLDVKPTESDTSEDCESTISESKEPLLDESSQTSSSEMFSNRSSSLTEGQAFGSQPSRSSIHCNDSKGIWVQRGVTLNETESSGLSNTDSSLRHNRHDSWEFDSGAHDLEIDTISLHKQIEASGIEMPSNINELLDLTNKYYIESIHCIKHEKSLIHSQLKSILKEHEFLQKQILYVKDEKLSIIRELEKKRIRERKEYEDKITELQSIIGELTQNLNYYQFLTIKEEEDESNGKEKEKTIGLQSNRDTEREDSNDCNSESNKNLKTGVICNESERQTSNDWVVLLETENVNKTHPNDRQDREDRHAVALQIDRLECRITNLETQIDLSALHLNESKENAERLTVLLGKYDSNNTALQLALNYSDKALEINELLVALLESEIGLVLANCRAAGLGKSENMSELEEKQEVMRIYDLAHQNRKKAEESAFDYLMKNYTEFDIKTKKTFNRELENNLRYILNKLKEEKSIVKNSITKLEPFIVDSDEDIKSMSVSNPMTPNSALNIENIVLMQDFVAIKELNADLRSQIYLLKKENSNLVQQMMKLKTNRNDCIESNENESNDLETNKFTDALVNDLKKVNGHLCGELEKMKKRYAIKVKKLEQKITYMNQKNSAQVKILQNKISLLKNEGTVRKCIETTL